MSYYPPQLEYKAGSLFVFKGKYRAVLINYPTVKEKIDLINEYFKN
jgi:cyclase